MTNLPPMPIIVRPSGVWDSRAPFNEFLREHRALNRNFHALTLAVYRLRSDAERIPSPLSAYRFLEVKGAGFQAGASWTGYRLSFALTVAGQRPMPTVDEFMEDLRDALYFVRESIIAACSAMFETFVQCWALNFLLARLERGVNWTADETELAKRLSPVHATGFLPGVPAIVKAIPDLATLLAGLAHIKTDPATRRKVAFPVSPELNALRAITFWRDYRNQIVHRSKVVSLFFYRKNNAFWEEFRKPYKSYMGPLQVGKRLQLYDDIVRAMMTTHYEAASMMNDWLKVVSGQRRGHPFAPDPEPVPWPLLPQQPDSPPLLVPGDHAPSYQWVAQFSAKPTP